LVVALTAHTETGAAQHFLYVGAGKGIAILDRKSLDFLGMIEVPGQLGAGHHIATDFKGNLSIAKTAAGLQKWGVI
jgi:hypothetical protein